MDDLEFRFIFNNGNFFAYRYATLGELLDDSFPLEKMEEDINAESGIGDIEDYPEYKVFKSQYVGLKDKFRNDKKVFEGDIYEWCGITYPITVDDTHGYRFMFGKDILCKSFIDTGKYLGNIYENKNLINKIKQL